MSDLDGKEVDFSVREGRKKDKEPLAVSEKSRQFGNFYQNLIQSSLRDVSGDIDSEIQDEATRVFADSVSKSVRSHLKSQSEVLVNMEPADAVGFLSQIGLSSEKKKLIEQGGKALSVEHAEGLYEVRLGVDLYKELFPFGGQAMLVSPANGVSFIVTRTLPGKEAQTLNEKYAQENLPHETHHLFWKFLEEDGLLTNNEGNPEVARAFSKYRDEFIARAVSEGFLGGYSHLHLNERKRKALEASDPEIVARISDIIVEMNESAEEINNLISRSPMKKTDLILSALSSTNFDELKEHFKEVHGYLTKTAEPIEQRSGHGGWKNV